MSGMFDSRRQKARERREKIAEKLKKNNGKQELPAVPFEQREELKQISVFVTIINRHQAQYYVKTYEECGASLSLVLYAYSMPPNDLMQIMGIEETKKDIIFTVCRDEDIPALKKVAADRFKISKAAKGVAFAVPIDSVSGIAVYKFLSDFNREVRENGSSGK